jgi:hypothetical protein
MSLFGALISFKTAHDKSTTYTARCLAWIHPLYPVPVNSALLQYLA